jgi:quercetin dioxygenase-like cupin family protein
MRLVLPGGVSLKVVVRSEDSDGRFCLLTDRLPPGWSLPPHRHVRETETIAVQSGHLRMTVDGVVCDLAPGDITHVAAGVLHDGTVIGDEAVERTVIFSPGGMERFFEQLSATGDRREALRLAHEHGWRFD